MTKSEATKMWENGALVLVGKFMKSTATQISVRDTKNGGRRAAVVARTVIATANDFFTFNEFLPDGSTVEGYKAPAKQGDQVVVFIEAMEQVAGTPSITRGRVEVLA